MSESTLVTRLLRACRVALPLLAGAVLLSGCATGFKLENSVQAFSSLPALPANATFRFERLPSQSAQQAAQSQLESLADPALFEAGLRRDDAAPRFAVQVGARVTRTLSPWADPFYGPPWGPWGPWGWGAAGWGGRHRGAAVGMAWGPYYPSYDQPWWQREVSVLVRELAGNRVVFESRAVSDGPWYDDATVLAAMFKAAMQGFPNPPEGVRRVDLQVGGKQQAQAKASAPAAPAGTAPVPAQAPAPSYSTTPAR